MPAVAYTDGNQRATDFYVFFLLFKARRSFEQIFEHMQFNCTKLLLEACLKSALNVVAA